MQPLVGTKAACARAIRGEFAYIGCRVWAMSSTLIESSLQTVRRLENYLATPVFVCRGVGRLPRTTTTTT
jgi:hypothetical protein